MGLISRVSSRTYRNGAMSSIDKSGLLPTANRPIRTLYIQNLETKINKQDTIRLIYTFFTQFGSVLDRVHSRHPKHRGQAYVSYRDLNASAMALRGAQNFPLGGKALKVAYARRDSDRVNEYLGLGNEMTRKKQASMRKKDPKKEETLAEARQKRLKLQAEQAAQASDATQDTLIGDPEHPPNHIIFLEHLPNDSTDEMVEVLFNQFEGYKEVRMSPTRKDLAFVEFATSANATKAKEALDKFQVTPSNVLKITYAKM